MATERNAEAESLLLERPLSARSVIASLLLGMHPPRMPGARLVQWCGAFGIADGTARVALSRMVDRGELIASAGTYELGGTVRARQRSQDWSLTPVLGDWDGEWRLAAVRPAARDATDRAALRHAFRGLRYAEQREGCWVRPDNLPRASSPAAAWTVTEAQCEWWRARPEQDAVALAAHLFDPSAWATRARALHDHLELATELLARVLMQPISHARSRSAPRHSRMCAPTRSCRPRCARSRGPAPPCATRTTRYQRRFGRAVREWFRAGA